MAIPWLIATVAVAGIGILLKESDEEKFERKQREREAKWEEEDRIREEAREKGELAQKAEERRQQEAQARDLEQFAYAKGETLAEKYTINDFSKSIADLAINNPESCEQEFKHIFLQSSNLSDMNIQQADFENVLLEIDELSALLEKV